jgi:nucleoside-diphosphate-sugar epimerase
VIVVTGADGFIGKHLCARLECRGEIIHRIDLKRGTDIRDCDLPDAKQVYHLAAQTDAYCKDARSDASTNIIGSLRVFERYTGRVVFASSAMVNYPVNPYAISKRVCEDYARYFGCAVVRLPNVYGDGGHSFMEKCAAQDEITIFGSGDQIRSWCHVNEAVEAFLQAKPGACVVVPGVTQSVNQIASCFDKPKRYLPARDGDLMVAVQQ